MWIYRNNEEEEEEEEKKKHFAVCHHTMQRFNHSQFPGEPTLLLFFLWDVVLLLR